MKNLVSKEGLAELEKELEERKTLTREEIANEIEKAREQGDLSENAAYKSAMEKKEMNEMLISKLEEMIANSEVIEENSRKNSVGLGNKIKFELEATGAVSEYELVGQSEADPSSGKISIQSPLGLAMLKKKKGDLFKLSTPAGENTYKIIEIN